MSAPLDLRLSDMAQRARQWIAIGRLDEAVRAWEQVLRAFPDYPEALLFLGQQRLQSGDARGARDFFARAVTAAPKDAVAAMNLSFAQRALGDQAGEMAALDAALAADAYCYPALLAKGTLLERCGRRREAARLFRDALKIVPPDEQLAPQMRAAVSHARMAVRENAAALDAYLERKIGPARHRQSGIAVPRFELAKQGLSGQKKIFHCEPSLLEIPQLPAIPFYDDRSLFPWLEGIEAQTGTIREELLGLLRLRAEKFRPYVHYAPGTPLNQWEELNNSPRWAVEYLWERGIRNDEVCALCPRTAEALSVVPFSRIRGVAPDALFSALQPHTRIPPHSGVTNARLLVHVPLIIPENCGFRVANDVREWREGHAWVFDDTIEHEAWNESDKLRVIMIFETWHPLLSEAERDLISELIAGYFDYEAEEAGLPAAPNPSLRGKI